MKWERGRDLRRERQEEEAQSRREEEPMARAAQVEKRMR
jgi:hypothetical protein